MKEYLKMAWRNIWRNKRRTYITLASLFFAVFFALIMRGIQIGSYGNMVDNVVLAYTGYIQVHANGYWEDKVINKTLESSDELFNTISSLQNVKGMIPRLESFALASVGLQTKGVMVVGIDPEKEDPLTKISNKIVKGQYLNRDSDGVLVAERLAKYLKIDINDTLVLIGQGYHGISAAGKYPVSGIVNFPSPELDNQLVYMNLPTCQYFYSSENRLTSIVVDIEDTDKMNNTADKLKEKINPELYEVMTWKEMLTELVQSIEADNVGGLIMLGILYIIIAFGVFGTIMMMTAERIREFGVMVAVGMRKFKLAIIVVIETIYIGILGIISGSIGSIPILIYLYFNPIRLTGDVAKSMENYGIDPIMPVALEPGYFINQSLVVFIILFIAIIYPAFFILRLNVINALRS